MVCRYREKKLNDSVTTTLGVRELRVEREDLIERRRVLYSSGEHSEQSTSLTQQVDSEVSLNTDNRELVTSVKTTLSTSLE